MTAVTDPDRRVGGREPSALAIMTPRERPRRPESVFERERRFHDGWASRTAAPEVRVRAAFEAVTAPGEPLHPAPDGRPRAAAALLDLGSGLGEAAVYFALRGARVTATDISPEMCALAAGDGAAARRARSRRSRRPWSGSTCPPASFDVVYGANLLHHVADLDRTLAAVRRALRPGGRCFFWDPLAYNPVDQPLPADGDRGADAPTSTRSTSRVPPRLPPALRAGAATASSG